MSHDWFATSFIPLLVTPLRIPLTVFDLTAAAFAADEFVESPEHVEKPDVPKDIALHEVALRADFEFVLEQSLQQFGGEVLVPEPAHFREELVAQE